MGTPTETPLTFPGPEGIPLAGMLHQPQPPQTDLAVLFLSAGLEDRIGANRLYVRLARTLADRGIPSLRFDPRGIGNSGGHWPNAVAAEHFLHFERGGQVPDALAGLEELLARTHARRVLALGLCGGGITATMAAAQDRRITHIVLWALPVVHSLVTDVAQDGGGEEPAMIYDYDAHVVLAGYLNKLLDLSAWRKLLGGQSDYRLMALMAWANLKRLIRPSRWLGLAKAQLWNLSAAARRSDDLDREVEALLRANPRFNGHVYRAMLEVLTSHRPTLLIQADSDSAAWDFDRELRPLLTANGRFERWLTLHTVAEANHEFQWPAANRALLETTTAWILRQAAR